MNNPELPEPIKPPKPSNAWIIAIIIIVLVVVIGLLIAGFSYHRGEEMNRYYDISRISGYARGYV